VLLANGALILAALASYPAFYWAGMWSRVTALYIVITIGLFAMCAIALAISKNIDALSGLTFYAWCGFGAVFGMVVIDILNGSGEFPRIFYLLLVGIFGLGYYDVKLHKLVYTIATVLTVALAGAIYRQYDQAVACVMAACLVSLLGRWRE